MKNGSSLDWLGTFFQSDYNWIYHSDSWLDISSWVRVPTIIGYTLRELRLVVDQLGRIYPYVFSPADPEALWLWYDR